MPDLNQLAPRERQIMNVLMASGSGTVADVLEAIADAPSYSTVRAILAKLERKGFVVHEEVDRAYRYKPVGREQVRRSAVRHMLDTFFGGSTEKAVSALLKFNDDQLSDDELDRLAALVDSARVRGSKT